jgi:hypothetical protein
MGPIHNLKVWPKSRSSICSSSGSPIEEARNLVKRCAEPRPVGDSVKAAINRAAKRLGFTYSRTKDIWYCGARRIDASEMDRLRRSAAATDFEQAVIGLRRLRDRLAVVSSPKAHELVDQIDAALDSGKRGRPTSSSAGVRAGETAVGH